MKWIYYVLALYAVHCEVIVLSDSNFTEFVESHSPVLVKFYSPYCGHCRALKPDYIALSEKTKQCAFAEVDVNTNRAIGSQYSIQGIPELKLLIKNQPPLAYEGNRMVNDMLKWVTNMIKQEVVHANSIDQVEKFNDSNVALWINYDHPELLGQYTKRYSEFTHYQYNNASLKKNQLILYNTWHRKKEMLDLNNDNYDKIIKIRSTHKLINFDNSLGRYFSEDKIPFLLLAGNYGFDIMNEYESIVDNATKYYGDFIYVRAHYKDYETNKLLKELGLEMRHMPCLLIINNSDSQLLKYMLSNITVHTLEQFISAYRNNTLQRWYKSQIPPIIIEKPFIGIIGSEFHRIVNHSCNFLVVHETTYSFYTKKFKQTLRNLLRLIPSMDLTIGFIDILKNEYEGLKEYDGFGVELVLKNQSETYTFDYNNKLDMRSLYEFLHKHIPTISYDGYIYGGDPLVQEI